MFVFVIADAGWVFVFVVVMFFFFAAVAVFLFRTSPGFVWLFIPHAVFGFFLDLVGCSEKLTIVLKIVNRRKFGFGSKLRVAPLQP